MIPTFLDAALVQLDDDGLTPSAAADNCRNDLVRLAREVPALDRPPSADPEDREWLAAMARLAEAIAPHLCHRDPRTGIDCSWYHGFWPYLRLLGMAATPHRHSGFYDEVFGALAADGRHQRVLVTGTADYAMPSRVVAAYAATGAPLDLEVTDLCATPMFFCRWYGRLTGVDLSAHARDVLACVAEPPYDVVCSHSFLPRFTAEGRQALALRWRDLLRPGGKVVSLTRINPAWREEEAGFSPAAARGFRDRVRDEATARTDLGLDPESLAAQALAYAQNNQHWSVTSVDELTDLFTGAGFAIDRLTLAERRGKVTSGAAGPGTAQVGTYAEFVLSRR